MPIGEEGETKAEWGPEVDQEGAVKPGPFSQLAEKDRGGKKNEEIARQTVEAGGGEEEDADQYEESQILSESLPCENSQDNCGDQRAEFEQQSPADGNTHSIVSS